MAKYKIDWSIDAKQDLFDALEFYIERNGSTNFSRKLNSKIKKSVLSISKNPFVGLKTDIEYVRALITNDYLIIYEILGSKLLIVMLWDCRRNPEDKKLGQRIK